MQHNFHFPNLSSNDNQIRLLSIDSVDDLGIIHCSLRAVCLDSFPEYVALSYVWGEEDAAETILVNGLQHRIRPNLYDFFNIVAVNELIGVRLFVDAICINQSDVEERSAQVALMKCIYSEAERVIAWLGNDDDMWLNHPFADTSRVLAVSREIDQEARQLIPKLDDISRIVSENSFKNGEDAEERILHLLDEKAREDPELRQQMLEKVEDLKRRSDDLHYVAFQFSYRKPFWERVWIVQEVILAKKLFIRVGKHAFDPEYYLTGIVQRLETTKLGSDPMVIFGSSVKTATQDIVRRETRIYDLVSRRAEWRERLSNGPPIKLYEVLIRFSQQRSSEPLDQIFGFLGLAQSIVKPVYNLTRIELYTYVFIEGLRELLNVSIIRQDLNAPWTFYQASLSAFRFSASDPAIILISNKALRLCGLRWNMRFLILTHGIFTSHPAVARGSGDFQDPTVMGSPRMELFKTIVWNFYALARAIITCIWLCSRIRYFKFRNSLVVGPDGDVRSFSEWTSFVENTSLLVRKGLPPRSAIPTQDNNGDEENILDSLPILVKIIAIVLFKITAYLVVVPLARIQGTTHEVTALQVARLIVYFGLRILRIVLRPWFWLRRLWVKLPLRAVQDLSHDTSQNGNALDDHSQYLEQ